MALEDEDARKWDGIDRKLSEVTAHTRIEKPKPICLMLRTNKALNELLKHGLQQHFPIRRSPRGESGSDVPVIVE
jgi:hypothetical protein